MGRNRVEAMDGVMNEVAMDEVGERMRKRMKMKIKTEMAAVGYLLLQAALGIVCECECVCVCVVSMASLFSHCSFLQLC